jgi:YgiT-type zinc finger domain-containing protein
MKCPICKHGSTHKGHASITLERDGATLLFKDVPADICDNCGEIYHDEKVTRSLLEQAEQASTQGVELDVRRYAAA